MGAAGAGLLGGFAEGVRFCLIGYLIELTIRIFIDYFTNNNF